jgi:hypothetical protein
LLPKIKENYHAYYRNFSPQRGFLPE